MRFVTYPISFRKEDRDVYEDIVTKLIEGGSVAINMGGRYGRNPDVYMAVANLIGEILIRTIDDIHAGAVANIDPQNLPKIVVYLEEAHRFLGRESRGAGYSVNPYSRIAREYRKFGLIVVPIDQMPSKLDEDVVSMLASKFIFALSNAQDIQAVTIDMPMSNLFRKVISQLSRGKVVFHSWLTGYPVVIDLINIAEDRLRYDGEERLIYQILQAISGAVQQGGAEEGNMDNL